jgi:hypothetical protein
MQFLSALSPRQLPRVNTIHWVRWWLLFSLAFGVLAPGLSHALPNLNLREGQRIAVCTASGMKYIHWETTDTAPVMSLAHECLVCALGGDLPFDSNQPFRDWREVSDPVPNHSFTRVHRPHDPWVMQAIRAPPVF